MRFIANLPPGDRRALFANAAEKAGLTEAIIEKDFWVCWTLDYLFHRCEWRNDLSFKGGTSLSKAFRLIERFSEDIDIVLNWQALGYSISEPWEQRSNTKQDQFNKEANERTIDFLRDFFVPSIQAEVSAELNTDIRITPDEDEGQTVLFTYPQEFSDQSVLQVIRLEIGSLGAWTPASDRVIKPYAAEQYGHLFHEPATAIRTVLPERTFWEKATILHHEANRPIDSNMPQRYSRHYYDLYCLAGSWVKEAAFADMELLKKVVDFKRKFYPRSWARYEHAFPGTMKLMPPLHNMKWLENDYTHTQSMIFGVKPGFQKLMDGILYLEKEINNLKLIKPERGA